jgi:hypothetical protein
MRRMRELIEMVKSAHPGDDFFSSLDETLKRSSQARASYRAYDRALSIMDTASWNELSKKAVAHFIDHRKGQLKQGFFNQLNDAFAYEFLVRRGYSDVSVLPEGRKTTPDLAYRAGTELRYCEVKTTGISDQEILRFESEEVFDGSVYQELSTGFFNKLNVDLKAARSQIASQGASGLIFIVAHFDDFTLSYYNRYRQQLSDFLRTHEVRNVVIKVGLLGRRRISSKKALAW